MAWETTGCSAEKAGGSDGFFWTCMAVGRLGGLSVYAPAGPTARYPNYGHKVHQKGCLNPEEQKQVAPYLPDGALSGMVRFRRHVWTQDKRLARVEVLSSATNVRT
jgi:hypothetical protein